MFNLKFPERERTALASGTIDTAVRDIIRGQPNAQVASGEIPTEEAHETTE